eukprot:351652-Chlamydomonas_euryale.AAC.8
MQGVLYEAQYGPGRDPNLPQRRKAFDDKAPKSSLEVHEAGIGLLKEATVRAQRRLITPPWFVAKRQAENFAATPFETYSRLADATRQEAARRRSVDAAAMTPAGAPAVRPWSKGVQQQMVTPRYEPGRAGPVGEQVQAGWSADGRVRPVAGAGPATFAPEYYEFQPQELPADWAHRAASVPPPGGAMGVGGWGALFGARSFVDIAGAAPLPYFPGADPPSRGPLHEMERSKGPHGQHLRPEPSHDASDATAPPATGAPSGMAHPVVARAASAAELGGRLAFAPPQPRYAESAAGGRTPPPGVPAGRPAGLPTCGIMRTMAPAAARALSAPQYGHPVAPRGPHAVAESSQYPYAPATPSAYAPASAPEFLLPPLEPLPPRHGRKIFQPSAPMPERPVGLRRVEFTPPEDKPMRRRYVDTSEYVRQERPVGIRIVDQAEFERRERPQGIRMVENAISQQDTRPRGLRRVDDAIKVVEPRPQGIRTVVPLAGPPQAPYGTVDDTMAALQRDQRGDGRDADEDGAPRRRYAFERRSVRAPFATYRE